MNTIIVMIQTDAPNPWDLADKLADASDNRMSELKVDSWRTAFPFVVDVGLPQAIGALLKHELKQS